MASKMTTIIDVDELVADVAPDQHKFASANGGDHEQIPLSALLASDKSPTPYFQTERVSDKDPDLGFARENEGTRTERPSIFSESSSASSVRLRFENIKYEVDDSKKKKKKKEKGPNKPARKQILKGITGEVRPGNVLAIMGSSGAGKTTLLNLLAGRLSAAGNGHSSGRVLVNGEKRNFGVFTKMSAYVLQDDIFFAELTVHETIALSARLRLPSSVSAKEREHRVERIIDELGLGKVRDSMVGSAIIRGVSGGERKRVNIGTELITNPSLVFLDEPTSGLDAFNAQNVMDNLLLLAKGGRTIVCTIHQPRSEIYSLLDQLMLLSEGYCLYMGDAKLATAHFSRLGFNCPPLHNPADYFLDLISLDTRNEKSTVMTKKRIQFFAEAYADNLEQNPLPPSEQDITSSQRAVMKYDRSRSKYTSSWPLQFGLLLKRAFTVMKRERATNIARFGQVIVFSILLSLIWSNEADDSAASVQSVAGVFFFLLINQSFSGVFQIIFSFPEERGIVDKERASRSYRVSAYFLSKTLVDLPRTFLANLIFSAILYPIVGFRLGAEHFFKFVLVVLLVTLSAESVAYVVSSIAKTSQQAGALAPIFVITSLLFGGFFINLDDIPVWLSWLRYLSFIKYGFAAALQVEYENRDLSTAECAMSPGFCPMDGDTAIKHFDADEFSYWGNLGFLLLLTVFFRAIAYWILRRKGPVFDTTI